MLLDRCWLLPYDGDALIPCPSQEATMRPQVVVPAALLCTLALSAFAEAQQQQAKPFSLADTVYLPGARATMTGAFDVWDRARCSTSDFQRAVGVRALEDSAEFSTMAVGVDKELRKTTVGAHARVATTKLNRALDALRANGDILPGARTLCVGYMPFLTTPSLVSSRGGFIAVEPTTFAQVSSADNGSEYTEELLYFHALGHQLQYWLGHRFESDPAARRRELQADCVAGALAVMTRLDRNSLGGVNEINRVNLRAQAGANALASRRAENPSARWPPPERRLATGVGSILVAMEASENSAAVARRTGVHTVGLYMSTLTGRRLLDLCANFIDKSD